jgi:chromosome segregation ATPase
MSSWFDAVVSAIRELKDKKDALEAKKEGDTIKLAALREDQERILSEISKYEETLAETERNISAVTASIDSTEGGLKQIMDSGTTLMQIANANLQKSRQADDSQLSAN